MNSITEELKCITPYSSLYLFLFLALLQFKKEKELSKIEKEVIQMVGIFSSPGSLLHSVMALTDAGIN